MPRGEEALPPGTPIIGVPFSRFLKKEDRVRVVVAQDAHRGGLEMVSWTLDFLDLVIAAKEQELSVPPIAFFIPGFGRLPDKDVISATIEASELQGVRTARELLRHLMRPSVVRFWLVRAALQQTKRRVRGKFAVGRGPLKGYINGMRIRLPHR